MEPGGDHPGAHADAEQRLVAVQCPGDQLALALEPGVALVVENIHGTVEQDQRIAVGQAGRCFPGVEMENGMAVSHAGQPVGDSPRTMMRAVLEQMQMHGNLAIQE